MWKDFLNVFDLEYVKKECGIEVVIVLCIVIFPFNILYLCRHAWDMAAEICLAQLPTLLEDPNAEFQVCTLVHDFIGFNGVLQNCYILR